MKLGPDCSVLDWFTPQNYDYLNSIDADLSSSGGMLVTVGGSQRLLAGGKEGKLYVLAPGAMGKFNANADTQIPQEFQASGGHIHSSKTFWNSPAGPVLYLWGESDYLKAFKYSGGAFLTSPSSRSGDERGSRLRQRAGNGDQCQRQCGGDGNRLGQSAV